MGAAHQGRPAPADQPPDIEAVLTELAARAVGFGATEVARVAAADILVADKFARYCRDPGCPYYGQGASCPPAVGGPAAFRHWVGYCADALVVRLDVPASALYSSQRHEIMAFLHHVVAGVEHGAKELGYTRSRAFAGGSCKELFCSSHSRCRYLSSAEGCRNPETARPSMSGFGIDVGHLMSLAGWAGTLPGTRADGQESMSWVAGLVLVG